MEPSAMVPLEEGIDDVASAKSSRGSKRKRAEEVYKLVVLDGRSCQVCGGKDTDLSIYFGSQGLLREWDKSPKLVQNVLRNDGKTCGSCTKIYAAQYYLAVALANLQKTIHSSAEEEAKWQSCQKCL